MIVFFSFFFAKNSHRMYTIYTHAHTHSTGRQHDGRMRQREFPPESSRPRPPPPRRNRGVSPFRHSHRTLRIGTETREGFTVGCSPSERQRGARNTHEPPPGHRRQKGRRHVGMFSMPGAKKKMVGITQRRCHLLRPTTTRNTRNPANRAPVERGCLPQKMSNKRGRVGRSLHRQVSARAAFWKSLS